MPNDDGIITYHVPEINGDMIIPEHIQMTNPVMQSAAPSPVFDVRNLAWEGISTAVPNNVTEALQVAGLNWTVIPRPIFVDMAEVPGRIANIRSDLPPGSNVLEIVGSKYHIVQNKDGLSFVQSIINNGMVKLENAGMFGGGKSIFLLAKTTGLRISGEDIQPYVVFANSHDGSGKVKVALTTVRVVCKNTLALALKTAPRVWSVTHTKSADNQMKAAMESMNFIGTYLTEYPAKVESMMENSVSDAQLEKIVNAIFPIPEKTLRNKSAVAHATLVRDTFMRVYTETPDLKRHAGTEWGVYNAITDMESHMPAMRNTKTFAEKRLAGLISGNALEYAQGMIARYASA